MSKLLLILLAAPVLAMASSLDMSTLTCKGVILNSKTTLKNVQDNCMIKKEETSNGRYEVKFVNSSTKKTVSCYFAQNTPDALLNSCK